MNDLTTACEELERTISKMVEPNKAQILARAMANHAKTLWEPEEMLYTTEGFRSRLTGGAL
jgi:hypothetical protein